MSFVKTANMRENSTQQFLPMTAEEIQKLGWKQCDVILISGDAFVDHPAFGAALIARYLEWLGLKVGILAQPDPHNPESFLKLGAPKLFCGITAGNVDSNLAALTVLRKKRSNNPYSPESIPDMRPRNATIVYTSLARHFFKNVPIVIGGIESSLRRFAYYDYWSNAVRRSILFDSKADILIYGMAESPLKEFVNLFQKTQTIPTSIPGTALIVKEKPACARELPAYEEVSSNSSAGRRAFMNMTKIIEEESNPFYGRRLIQKHDNRYLLINPPAPPLSTEELDLIYNLPFTRKPHPIYAGKRIPAYEMIKDSITTHRGCYGGCRFCAIGAHQGKIITSRSISSVLSEVSRIASDKNFKGTISDLGGATANMYGTYCKKGLKNPCKRTSCLFPKICQNLQTSHQTYLELLKKVRTYHGIKHSFVSSGIRFDLALLPQNTEWLEELVAYHIPGRIKIAPEHISEKVLKAMHKPSFHIYRSFIKKFLELSHKYNKKHAIAEYFITSLPTCGAEETKLLASFLKKKRISAEQIQDFYPAPLTMATAMYYTGLSPDTMQPIYVPASDREKKLQRTIVENCNKLNKKS
jgi:uncharacterized radical SAM protein YgiQ